MMLFRYAWRNLWRNRSRTGIILGAVVFNTSVLIILYALCKGMVTDTISNATNISFGEVQIHAPEYREKRSFYETVENPDAVVKQVQALGADAAKRSFGFGLAAHGKKSAGAQFWGVDPRAEKKTFAMAGHLIEGDFLADTPGMGVVLGRKLAHSLGVRPGDELIVLVQAADGSLGNELYTVTGILKGMGEEIDRSAALLHINDFNDLFVSYGFTHQVAVNSHGRVEPEIIAAGVNKNIKGVKAETWKELLPMMADMVHMFDSIMVVFVSVFSLAAGLGVMNALIMATYERMREFGAVKALGASPWRIIVEVAAEALFIALIGCGVGVVIALVACQWLSVHGIDLSFVGGNISFAGVAFETVWRASLEPKMIITSVASMSIISVLAALYPAILAARLDPVQIMRRP